MSNTTTDTSAQIIEQVLLSWNAQNKRVSAFFNKYPNNAYLGEVAEGRNRAVYLLGHLTAVNDALLPLLALGDRLYPELENTFLTEADNKAEDHSVADLKEKWEAVNAKLNDHFGRMTTADWLGRHMSISEEDFAKEPLRNKLNVILNRTAHQSYHIGQLVFLKEKEMA